MKTKKKGQKEKDINTNNKKVIVVLFFIIADIKVANKIDSINID